MAVLALGLSQWSLSHVWLHLTRSSNWVWRSRFPHQRQFLPVLPRQWESGMSPATQVDGMQATPPWSSLTKMRAVFQLRGKCVQNELQVSLHKGEGETLLGCNLWFLKGVFVPRKQSPEAQFQLISAKLATANEHCNCQ